MINLSKICHKLMDSNHELRAKYALLEQENEQLKEELKKLKIDNKGKDDAIDGLREMMAHYNLGDLE